MVKVSIDGQFYLVEERIARMVRWLIERREDICGPDKVSVEFHCAGKDIQRKLTHHEILE